MIKGSFRPIVPFEAGAAVAVNRIVKLGAPDGKVVQAAAADDALLGVSDRPARDGETADVCVHGVAVVESGGAIAQGAWVTTDADGKALAAVAGNSVIGRALTAAAAGGSVGVRLSPGVLPGAGGSVLLQTTVTLSQAQIRDLHNTRVVLVPAEAGKYILVDHFIFAREAGAAATDQRNSLPRLGILLVAAAGGQVPSQGAGGYFERVVYGEIISGIITAAAYRYRIGVGNHFLVANTPLVVAMNAGPVTGDPTGTFTVRTYYETVEEI